MPAVRSISALRPSVLAMADAATQANIEVVRKATVALSTVVEANGRRFKIRGRDGRKWPLEAANDVRVFGDFNKPVGQVRGIPEGFWEIVEHGSSPHLIVSNKGRGGVGRTTRSGRAAAKFMTSSQVLRRFATGDSLGALQPLRTPYGPRQFVHHPGHGSIGRPWAESMAVGPTIVGETLVAEQFKAQFRAFTGQT